MPLLRAEYFVCGLFSVLAWSGISERVGGIALSLGELLSVFKQDTGVSEGPGSATRRLQGVQEQQKLQPGLEVLQSLLAAAQKVLGLAEAMPGNKALSGWGISLMSEHIRNGREVTAAATDEGVVCDRMWAP